MSRLLLVMAFTILLPTASLATPICWGVGSGGNGHCYQVIIVGSTLSWNDARSGAQGIGAGWDLATITSAAENAFVESLFANDPNAFNPALVGSNYVGPWIGGFSVFGSNNFQWVTGEPVTFTDWGPSEPFQNNGTAIAYADFSSPRGDGSGIAWNDIGPGVLSFGSIAYIAETAVPEPSTSLLLALGLVGLGLRRRH